MTVNKQIYDINKDCAHLLTMHVFVSHGIFTVSGQLVMIKVQVPMYVE